MKEGLNVILLSDKVKVERQILALKWQMEQPADEKSRKIYEETLHTLKAHLKKLQTI